MTNEPIAASSLAHRFRDQMSLTGLTVDGLADRTKIPRATIRWLLEEETAAVLPGRVYLRGQTAILAREMGMNVEAVLAEFDRRMPAEDPDASTAEPRPSFNGTWIGAGLGLALLAVLVIATL
jgi:cytoskeletal protein RodZ